MFPAQRDDGFERFWVAYPRHVGKKDARKAWAVLRPVPELVERILKSLVWQKTTPQWVRDGGQYVPYPGSWLRGERWDDEPFETRPMGKLTTRLAAAMENIRREAES